VFGTAISAIVIGGGIFLLGKVREQEIIHKIIQFNKTYSELTSIKINEMSRF
jgi:hypothetical protein